jgi:hypothetical protein
MSFKSNVLIASIGFSLLLSMFPSPASCRDISDVKVTNFPETQKVKGSVAIEGAGKAIKREGILVSRSRRNELTELFYSGFIDTEGYTSVSLYLQGEIRSATFPSGSIGVMMIPDEEPVLRALKESGQVQFPIETVCTIKSEDSEYFSCQQVNQNIGFSRYRIYLYNTLDKPAEVSTYIYLKK